MAVPAYAMGGFERALRSSVCALVHDFEYCMNERYTIIHVYVSYKQPCYKLLAVRYSRVFLHLSVNLPKETITRIQRKKSGRRRNTLPVFFWRINMGQTHDSTSLTSLLQRNQPENYCNEDPDDASLVSLSHQEIHTSTAPSIYLLAPLVPIVRQDAVVTLYSWSPSRRRHVHVACFGILPTPTERRKQQS